MNWKAAGRMLVTALGFVVAMCLLLIAVWCVSVYPIAATTFDQPHEMNIELKQNSDGANYLEASMPDIDRGIQRLYERLGVTHPGGKLDRFLISGGLAIHLVLFLIALSLYMFVSYFWVCDENDSDFERFIVFYIVVAVIAGILCATFSFFIDTETKKFVFTAMTAYTVNDNAKLVEEVVTQLFSLNIIATFFYLIICYVIGGFLSYAGGAILVDIADSTKKMLKNIALELTTREVGVNRTHELLHDWRLTVDQREQVTVETLERKVKFWWFIPVVVWRPRVNTTGSFDRLYECINRGDKETILTNLRQKLLERYKTILEGIGQQTLSKAAAWIAAQHAQFVKSTVETAEKRTRSFRQIALDIIRSVTDERQKKLAQAMTTAVLTAVDEKVVTKIETDLRKTAELALGGLPKTNGNSPIGLMIHPEGTRSFFSVPGYELIVIEQSPTVRNLRFGGEIVSDHFMSPALQKKVRQTNGYISLALPYTVFIIEFLQDHHPFIRVYFRPTPLKSLSDTLRPAFLPNVYDTANICVGSSFKHFDPRYVFQESLQSRVERTITAFWNSEFNTGVLHNFPPSDIPGAETLDAWEKSTERNPLFILSAFKNGLDQELASTVGRILNNRPDMLNGHKTFSQHLANISEAVRKTLRPVITQACQAANAESIGKKAVDEQLTEYLKNLHQEIFKEVGGYEVDPATMQQALTECSVEAVGSTLQGEFSQLAGVLPIKRSATTVDIMNRFINNR